MRLKTITDEEFKALKPYNKYRKTRYMKLFDDFLATGAKVMEVVQEPDEKRKAKYLAVGMCKAVKRFGYHIDVMRRKERVFLVRKD